MSNGGFSMHKAISSMPSAGKVQTPSDLNVRFEARQYRFQMDWMGAQPTGRTRSSCSHCAWRQFGER